MTSSGPIWRVHSLISSRVATVHDMIVMAAVLANLVISIGGFARIIVQYEHRFTKLETENQYILRSINELAKEFHHGVKS